MTLARPRVHPCPSPCGPNFLPATDPLDFSGSVAPDNTRPLASAMALVVRLPNGHTLRFTSPFHIGRERGCDVEVADNHVSRRHAEVSLSGRTWVIRDLQSSNGLFVNGKRVDAAPIGHGVQVTLGEDGPTLSIEPEESAQMSPDRETSEADTLESYAQRYFTSEDDEDESVGGR